MMQIIKEIREKKLPIGLATIYENLKRGNVLDLGCGAAREIQFLQEKGFNCSGVDINEKIINNNISDNSEINWVNCDARKFDLENYDLIIAKTLIHLFPFEEQKELIQNMKAHTNKHGINYIATFNDEIPMKGKAYLLKINELLEFYKDWKILQFAQRTTPLHTDPTNIDPHKHSVSIIIAQKIGD